MERRTAIELRVGGDGKSPRLHGYAAVFDSPSQDLGGFTEVVKPGAFKRSLASDADPLALVAHMPHLVLGRRSAGTLRLSEDARGLAFEIDVPATQAARDLLISIERGDVRGCSFAFTVPSGGDSWTVRGANAVRELRDIDLHEITVCGSPAYLDTTVAVRAFQARHVVCTRIALARRYLETV